MLKKLQEFAYSHEQSPWGNEPVYYLYCNSDYFTLLQLELRNVNTSPDLFDKYFIITRYTIPGYVEFRIVVDEQQTSYTIKDNKTSNVSMSVLNKKQNIFKRILNFFK